LRQEFFLFGLELFSKAGHVDPRLLGFREDAGTRLLFFADMMFDIFRQGFHLSFVILASRRGLQNISDQHFGAIMFHLSFVKCVALDILFTTGRIEKFLFQFGMNDQLYANLARQLLLFVILFALFKLREQLFDLPVIGLLEARRRQSFPYH